MPTICPECESKLVIEEGKKEDVIRLMCKNPKCKGTAIKKLQKGIKALEIRNLGPSTIKKLYLSGIENSFDLFNPEIFNEENLCNGYFKEGRALEKIMDSVDNVESIAIEKAILSLQIMVEKEEGEGFISIGESLSEQIGRMMSGVDFDYDGLSIQVREEVQNEKSPLYLKIKSALQEFENNDIEIDKFKKVEPLDLSKLKKVKKQVTLIGEPTTIDMTTEEFLNKLEWGVVDIKNSDMLIVENKNIENEIVEYAKDEGIKIMTFKQIKLLFL